MVEVSIVSRFHKDDGNLIKVSGLLNYAWVPQIIHRLSYYGGLRFNRIKRSLKGISSTSLSRSLSMLQEKGIVNRVVLDSTPPKVLYYLTEKGMRLAKIVESMLDLGKTWEEGGLEELEISKSSGSE